MPSTPFPAGKTWKEIECFPNYLVSKNGEVMNRRTGRKLKIIFDSIRKYPMVDIYQNGGKKRRSVHRIVATAFCPGKSEEKQVNHKNGDKNDNRSSNLEWVTASENIKHAFKYLGKKCLTRPVVQLDLKGRKIKFWPSKREAGKALGMASVANFAEILGTKKVRGGFRWREPTKKELKENKKLIPHFSHLNV